MDGLLRNYPGWQQIRITIPTNSKHEANPTTPIPAFSAEALGQFDKQAKGIMGKDQYYHEQPDVCPGLSACEDALNECLRRYGIISSELWVSNDCMREIITDMLQRYKSRFNGFIPYLYSDGTLSHDRQVMMQIKPVSVIIDANIPKGHIVCIVP